MTATEDELVERPTGGTRHPGFEWLSEGACTTGDESADGRDRLSPYFVEAGRVIGQSVQRVCKVRCPVRRECVLHAYLGGPNGTMIGAGYFGGFSLGERRTMTLEEALAEVDQDARRARPVNPRPPGAATAR